MKMKITLALTGILLMVFSSCKKTDGTPGTITTDPAVTITSISPATGPKNTQVTITGTNFGVNLSTLKVYFNGVQATVQTATNTTITATVPNGAGTGVVKVEKTPTVQANGPVFTYWGNGAASYFAGSGSSAFADGTGNSASFYFPTAMVKDAAGNFYIADRNNHRIRKMTAAGVVTTIAGSGTAGFNDGTGAAASFNQPYAITIDASGNLYVSDRLNYAIRKVTPAGVVTTVAGNGTPGNVYGTGSAARFGEVLGIAADASGNIFAADYNSSSIKKITPSGTVTLFAGTGATGMVDGTGSAAAFSQPFGLAFDAAGNLYVGDYHNHAIRKITPAAVVTTVAGNGTPGSANGTGSAATFNQPAGLTVDPNGNIYVCDVNNHTVRKITAAGVVTTFSGTAGTQGDTEGASPLYWNPLGVCGDFANNYLYVVDFVNNRIKRALIE